MRVIKYLVLLCMFTMCWEQVLWKRSIRRHYKKNFVEEIIQTRLYML